MTQVYFASALDTDILAALSSMNKEASRRFRKRLGETFCTCGHVDLRRVDFTIDKINVTGLGVGIPDIALGLVQTIVQEKVDEVVTEINDWLSGKAPLFGFGFGWIRRFFRDEVPCHGFVEVCERWDLKLRRRTKTTFRLLVIDRLKIPTGFRIVWRKWRPGVETTYTVVPIELTPTNTIEATLKTTYPMVLKEPVEGPILATVGGGFGASSSREAVATRESTCDCVGCRCAMSPRLLRASSDLLWALMMTGNEPAGFWKGALVRWNMARFRNSRATITALQSHETDMPLQAEAVRGRSSAPAWSHVESEEP